MTAATEKCEMSREQLSLRAAVTVAAETFERYADLHREKKTTDGEAKASANAALAEQMRAALAIPTVQAETAVVGALRRARSFIDACVGIGEFTPEGAENPCEIVEAIDAVLAPVSTGEQPGMSEEPFGHWVEHTAAEPVFILSSRGAYVPTGPNYKATALYTAPTLPDDLLSLSEAATQGEWEASTRFIGTVEKGNGFIAEFRHFPVVPAPSVASANAAFVAEAVNFIRTLAAKQGGKS